MSDKTFSIIPLNGRNYPTWKLQCKMSLMKEGLWSIVDGTEAAPAVTHDNFTRFVSRRNKALAIIVLSVEPDLLYILGDPESPITAWDKLEKQFQKKTWANK